MEPGLVDRISDKQVRAHLAHLLAAPDFAKAKQLRVLLEFLVVQTLSGLSSQINQTTIAHAVFNRDESFDSALDNLVRVEVGRLRKRLDVFYQEGGWLYEIRINIPKGTYVPEFVPQAAHKTGIGATLAGHRIAALRAHSPDGTLFHSLSLRTLRDVLLWLSNPLEDPQSVFASARRAAMVTLPGICPLQDIGLAANRVFMVFDFPSGELLSERLKKSTLQETKAVALLRNLSEEVAWLHAGGLVSGALRPHYVILSEEDEGIATLLLPATDPETRPDDTGRSPEQRNGLPADQRSDVWAIGSMIEASLPTKEPTSARLRELIARCLHIDPAQRFASAQELSIALKTLSQPASAAAAKAPGDWMHDFRPWMQTIIVCLSIVGSLGAGYIWDHSRRATASQEIRLAVLPFRGFGNDADATAAARTIPEMLATSLSGTPGIRLVSLRSLPRIESADISLRRVGKELASDYTVEGSVAKAGDALTITVRLASRADLSARWERTYRGSLSEIYEIEGRASADVAQALGTAIPAGGPSWKGRTNNPEAFRVWSQAHESALDYLNNLYLKPKDDVEQQLQRALELDPSYVDPMVDLGLVNWMAAFPPTPQQPQNLATAKNWFQKAIEREPKHPLAEAFLGRITFFEGDRQSGLQSIKLAARSTKDDPYVLFALADAYFGMGYWESALKAWDAMIKADPLMNLAYDHQAYTLYLLGRFDEAIKASEALPVNSPRRLNILATIYLRMGRVAEAQDQLKHLQSLDSTLPTTVLSAQMAAARGDLGIAKRIADRIGPGIRIVDGDLILYAQLGNERRLLESLLDHPLVNNYRWIIGQPALRRFQGSPQFRKLVREQYTAWQDGLAKLNSSLPVRPPKLMNPDEYFHGAAPGLR
jgi:TolB-like protein